jgi:hypothetical protein
LQAARIWVIQQDLNQPLYPFYVLAFISIAALIAADQFLVRQSDTTLPRPEYPT